MRQIIPVLLICLFAGSSSISAQNSKVALPNLDISKLGQLSKPSILSGDEDILKNDKQLKRFLKSLETVSIPIDPSNTGDELQQISVKLGLGCGLSNSPTCDRANAFKAAADRLKAAAAASPTCDAAAKEFRTTYSIANPTPAMAKRYDLACLGSFVARKDEGFGVPPILLADAEKSGGLLDAVGILELDGGAICSGLIRSDRTFVTARHCVQRKGTFTLSAASGAFSHLPLTLTRNGDWKKIGTPFDWAVLTLPAGPPLAVPKTNLVKLLQPASASFIALYPYETSTEYLKPEPLPKRALRYPKAGMCEAVASYNGCLQLVCQTIRGFSGAPIFSLRKADGSYDVVGLVSGSAGTDTGCSGGEPIPNSTYAVSSELIG